MIDMADIGGGGGSTAERPALPDEEGPKGGIGTADILLLMKLGAAINRRDDGAHARHSPAPSRRRCRGSVDGRLPGSLGMARKSFPFLQPKAVVGIGGGIVQGCASADSLSVA